MDFWILLATVALVVATYGLFRLADRPEGQAMSAIDALSLLLVLGLGVYLVIALLKPEYFQ